MVNVIRIYWHLIIVCAILTGCATTQQVQVPKLDLDPESAIIILKRPSTAVWNNPKVFDNGEPIGEIGNNGLLKWSRKEGIVELDIIFRDIWGNRSFQTGDIHAVFEVKKNKVYKINYILNGRYQPATVKLEGDELSEQKHTSSPPGALIYVGDSPSVLKSTNIKTPFTFHRTKEIGTWTAQYYKMSLEGYKDTEVIFKSNSFGNREVHFDLVPLQVPKPTSDVAVNDNASPPRLQTINTVPKPIQENHNVAETYYDTKLNSKNKIKTLPALPLIIPFEPNYPTFNKNDIAVIIGIEKYRTVPPTEYAAADAGMVRDYLKALGIHERNIEFLADDRATLSDIRKVIETKLPNMVKTNSRVIVYYAGHGAPSTTKG